MKLELCANLHKSLSRRGEATMPEGAFYGQDACLAPTEYAATRVTQ
jgi:hypothetical protein